MSTSQSTSKEILVSCQGAKTMELDRLNQFQGKLKKISKKNLERLKRRIISDGIAAPLFIWERDTGSVILDGHQRLKALKSLQSEGYDIPDIPVALIHAADENEARQRVLAISSQFGEWDLDELDDWLVGAGEDFSDTLRIVDGEIEIVDVSDTSDVEDQVSEAEPKPFNQVHVLLSMSQNVFFDIQDHLREIKNTDGVQYEQSQN